jgi:hypothetical protein
VFSIWVLCLWWGCAGGEGMKVLDWIVVGFDDDGRIDEEDEKVRRR